MDLQNTNADGVAHWRTGGDEPRSEQRRVGHLRQSAALTATMVDDECRQALI